MSTAPPIPLDKQDQIEAIAMVMKAIAHPMRLAILCYIGDEDASVNEIMAAVGTTQSNVSQHLAVLRKAAILTTRKSGNHIYHRIADERTLQLMGMMREVFCNP